MKYDKWIGFDLDGTLAQDDDWQGRQHIGTPIPKMIRKVKQHLDKGDTVKIFTARAVDPKNIDIVQDWLQNIAGLPRLQVTNQKDPGMTKLYDDRRVQVKKNTGRSIVTGKQIGRAHV